MANPAHSNNTASSGKFGTYPAYGGSYGSSSVPKLIFPINLSVCLAISGSNYAIGLDALSYS